MEKDNPLLPFAFKTSSLDERSVLNTDPRDRLVIDENASSMYHTRNDSSRRTRKGATLPIVPSLKRKMGESFNEKDDIKRRDFDQGLDDLSDHDLHDDNDQNCHFNVSTDPDSVYPQSEPGIPSSPPVLPHHSELDISTTTYSVPDSPVKLHATLLNTSPVKRVHHFQHDPGSSEADFGIDQFNRFRTSSYLQCPSTDVDMDLDQSGLSSPSHNEARHKILQAFEDMEQSVSLSEMGLTDIPEEIRDLNNLVVFTPSHPQSHYQLYLTNNKIQTINPALFAYTKLNVLSLRQNHIHFLPGAFRHLTNLVDLNIASNRLRFLPILILELPNLKTFSAGPNPYLPVSEDAIPIPSAECSDRHPKFVSPLRYHTRSGSAVASLKTLCLDAVAHYDVTYRETRSWKLCTPKIYHHLIAKAILKGRFEDTCSECDMVVVEPYADAYEWWDILKNTNVTFKREFCSGQCAHKHQQRIAHYLKR